MLLPWSERVVPPDSPQRLSTPEAPAGNAGSALRVALDDGGEAAQLCRQWLVCAEPGLGLGDVLGRVEDLKPHALHAVRPVDGGLAEAPALADVQG